MTDNKQEHHQGKHFPLFAKRPRQNLLAHPNNVNSQSNRNGSYAVKSARFQASQNINNIGRSERTSAPYNSTGKIYQQHQPTRPQYNTNRASFGPRNAHSGGNYDKCTRNVDRTNNQNFRCSIINPGYHGQNQTNVNYNNSRRFEVQRQTNMHVMTRPQFDAEDQYSHRSCYSANTHMYTYETVPYGPCADYAMTRFDSQPWQGAAYMNSPMPADRAMGNPYTPYNVPGTQTEFGYNRLNSMEMPQRCFGSGHGIEQGDSAQSKVESPRPALKKGASNVKMMKKDETSSTRVITITVQSLKYWTYHGSEKMSIIFEIFGKLSSPTVKGSTPCAKEFNISDEKENLPCVFYEIDRDLMRLVKGQWYRLMGKWKGDYLQVLSIRPMTGEEKRIYKLRINACDRALRSWQSRKREM